MREWVDALTKQTR